MATTLKARIQFPVIQPGARATLPHGLKWQGRAVVPDEAGCSSSVFAVVRTLTDDTDLTIQNNGLVPASCEVLVESWHTIERAFGDEAVTSLASPPFQAVASTVPAGIPTLFTDDGAVLEVYVDGAGGDDANDGLTELTAIRTIRMVYRKFPLYVYQLSQVRIHMAGVGGFGADATAALAYDIATLICNSGGSQSHGSAYQYVGPEMVPITPATGPATAALDVVPCVSVLGGSAAAGGTLSSRFDFTVAAPGWTVDDLCGKFLRITRAGVKVCWELPIARNTADTITVRIADLVTTPGFVAATDTAEIVEPAVQFYESVAGNGQCIVGDGGTPSGYGLGPSFVRCAFLEGCQILGSLVTFDRCDLDTVGWGVYIHGKDWDMVNCVFQYLLVVAPGGTLGLYPLETSASDPIAGNNRKPRMMFQTNAFYGWLDLYAAVMSTTSIGIDAWAAECVWCYAGGMLYLEERGAGGGYPPVAIQGVCDGAGPWIQCYNGGQARLPSNVAEPGATSVYGSGGGDPLSLNDGAGLTCDYGVGVGDWEEVAGYAGCLYNPPVAGTLGDPNSVITLSKY